MKASIPTNTLNEYQQLLEVTKHQILSTRIVVARSACQAQISLYWWIGEQIYLAQERYSWGNAIVDTFANDLTKLFPGAGFGFSARNIWDMRRLYLAYRDFPKLRQAVAEIPWGQNLVILNKIKDIKAREYYIEYTKKCGWTRSVLSMQIEAKSYERQILQEKQHNFDSTLPEHLAEQANKTMKNVYMLDTLGLTQPVLEYQLENAMVNKIQDVMMELGYGFTFIGNQYRIVAPSGTEAIIDLLFYSRPLQSLIALELKSGPFKPEYAGKMNCYLNLLDDLVKEKWENPSIGIILCSEKNHIDVEYALRGIDKPMGVSEFRLSKELPEALSNKIPEAHILEAAILKEMQDEE
ncbi:MAG: DUF1016 family protein [Rickettsiaceae bacterium]|nr:DUF1016 family protein [Rickettsiaceae bacterium]